MRVLGGRQLIELRHPTIAHRQPALALIIADTALCIIECMVIGFVTLMFDVYYFYVRPLRMAALVWCLCGSSKTLLPDKLNQAYMRIARITCGRNIDSAHDRPGYGARRRTRPGAG